MLTILLAFLFAATPHADAAQQQIVALEAAWNEAHVKGDAAALDALFSPDIVVVVPRMAPMSKRDALSVWRSGTMRFAKYATSDVAIRVLNNDTAIVTGRLQRTTEFNGREHADDWLFTKVYVRDGGKWTVVSYHASERPPD